jgi:hypothetical protein
MMWFIPFPQLPSFQSYNLFKSSPTIDSPCIKSRLDAVKEEDSCQMLRWRDWEVKVEDRERYGGRESGRPAPAPRCGGIGDDDDDDGDV